MSTQPLTPAEQAAAEALDAAEFDPELTFINEGSREEVARAVVAAVRSSIEADTLGRFADHLRALVATESFCDEAADSGMKLAASVAEDDAEAARQSLSRPTSEEH
jgi:hypothetical protein